MGDSPPPPAAVASPLSTRSAPSLSLSAHPSPPPRDRRHSDLDLSSLLFRLKLGLSCSVRAPTSPPARDLGRATPRAPLSTSHFPLFELHRLLSFPLGSDATGAQPSSTSAPSPPPIGPATAFSSRPPKPELKRVGSDPFRIRIRSALSSPLLLLSSHYLTAPLFLSLSATQTPTRPVRPDPTRFSRI